MRMLIDARHQEETRVAVVKGNRIEEFDFESAEHKQLKGNIYLAKVTRVEPSLQAAFVDYGGNRHGFLAFRKSTRLLPDPQGGSRSAAPRGSRACRRGRAAPRRRGQPLRGS
jgi:Ribonuclease G/E